MLSLLTCFSTARFRDILKKADLKFENGAVVEGNGNPPATPKKTIVKKAASTGKKRKAVEANLEDIASDEIKAEDAGDGDE